VARIAILLDGPALVRISHWISGNLKRFDGSVPLKKDASHKKRFQKYRRQLLHGADPLAFRPTEIKEMLFRGEKPPIFIDFIL
jgi:hypothetical protein